MFSIGTLGKEGLALMDEMWDSVTTVGHIDVSKQDDNYWIKLEWVKGGQDIWMTYEQARQLASVLADITKD